MYGDIGHGLILLLFSLYLIIFEKDLTKSILKPFLFAKYFLLLMGIFATYCGLLYNDFLSMPVDAGSCYEISGKNKNDALNRTFVTKGPFMIQTTKNYFVVYFLFVIIHISFFIS